MGEENPVGSFTDMIMMVIAMGFMFAYGREDVRMGIGTGMNLIFGPLNALPLHIIILLMALITGLFSTAIRKYMVNWEEVRANQNLSRDLQARMRALNKEFREAQTEENKHKVKKLEQKRAELMKEQAEMMRGQSGAMMQQFRPMFYTMPVILGIFGWMRYLVYLAPEGVRQANEIIVLPLVGSGTFGSSATNVLGFIPFWMFWYIICSFLTGQVVNKVLNVGMT